MESGWPLPKRRELIHKLNQEPIKLVHAVYFQGQRQDLAIRRVPIALPKYRLDNGRTRSAQAAYLSRHPELPGNLFHRDSESEVAQRAQHEILKSMLGTGDKELMRYFRTREQMQPFILTDLGFVLNGNRRLCALRELIEQDDEEGHQKKRFEHIDVVILPPADQRDLDKLEAIYQLTEDIKAPYSWTARAYMLRARRNEDGFDEQELSSIYQLPVSEVSDLLSMLSLAEEYLDEQGKSNQYELVDEDEFAFRQLWKARSKLSSEREKEAFQELAFCVIEKWDEGRLYAVIPKIADNIEDIRKAILDEISTSIEQKQNEAASLLGVKIVTVDPIVSALRSEGNRQKIREIVADVLDAATERDRERRRGNRVLTRLTKAHELLISALQDWDSANDVEPLKRKLAEIATTMDAIREKVNAQNPN